MEARKHLERATRTPKLCKRVEIADTQPICPNLTPHGISERMEGRCGSPRIPIGPTGSSWGPMGHHGSPYKTHGATMDSNGSARKDSQGSILHPQDCPRGPTRRKTDGETADGHMADGGTADGRRTCGGRRTDVGRKDVRRTDSEVNTPGR